MPTRWETFPIQVTGGLITDSPPIQLGINQPGAAIRLVNFEPSVRGGYRRINGYTKFDSNTVTVGADSVLGVAYFYGTVIACTSNGTISTSTGTGWTAEATGRTHANKYRFTKFNFSGTKKIIGVDGSNYPFSWDGTSVTVINGTTDVLGASHAIEFKDHMFYSKGDLVTFSVPFDETDFTVADGAGNFRMPEDVTGMAVFRQRLFVFTQSTIRVLDGSSSSDFTLTSVAESVGCIEPDTIVEVAGDVAFMSADGIRLLGATDRDGDFSNLVSSNQIQKDFEDFEQRYDSFHAIPIRGKQQYRIFGYLAALDKSLTEGYVGTQFEGQNPLSFQWGQLKGFKVYSADSQYYNGTEYIVFVSDDGYVYQMDDGDNFDGVGIDSSYWTPYISFNDTTYYKTLYHIHLFFEPEGNITGTLSPTLCLDDANKIQPPAIDISSSGGGAVYGAGVYGTSTYVNPPTALVKKQLIGTCYNASFQFEFLNGDAPFVLDTIFIEYGINDKK